MNSNFSAAVDYGNFYIWDEEYNDVAPNNTLHLSIVNHSGKGLAFYAADADMRESELYIAEIGLHFNFGIQVDCLLREEAVEGLAFGMSDAWSASTAAEIKNESMVAFLRDLEKSPQDILPQDTLSFIIRNVASKTDKGSAPVKVEIVYFYLSGNEVVKESAVFGMTIFKKTPRLEILQFYAQANSVSGGQKAVLCWDVSCADFCRLEQNGILLEKTCAGQGRFETELSDDTSFVLIAGNKKNNIRYAGDPVYITYLPDPLILNGRWPC